MDNKKYVAYLNTLHSYNAQNPNAYGEKNIDNEFFQETSVELEISKFIKKQFEETEPHFIVLTGHAGDGKTSLMYQVLNSLGGEFCPKEKIKDICFSNGIICRCIKDFSEIKDEDRISVLDESLEYPKKGNFVFMVSNTGPLINTFNSLIQKKLDPELIEIEKNRLIDAIDKNSGEMIEVCGCKVEVINVASVDNTDFSVAFIQKIIKDALWEKCQGCSNCKFCHIYRNVNLIKKNSQRVLEFIKQHYIWLSENGVRLTIRSMTEQLAYMITGGMECDQVEKTIRNQKTNKDTMLFFNLFFGYLGLKNNDRADSIRAIKEAKRCGYDKKRLRADEILMIDCNFKDVFGSEIANILEEASKSDNRYISGWEEYLRRAYIFTNIETDKKRKSETMEDIFSKHFEQYINLREGNSSLGSKETKLVTDALSMMYLGKIENKNNSEINITLSKSSGLTQNVQLITGTISSKQVKLIQSRTQDSNYHEMTPRYELKLQVDGESLDPVISLQMLNYFEELRNGIISTNIDPQLSHGVEKLKAQLSEKSQKNQNVIDIVVIGNTANPYYSLEITSEDKINVN